MNFIVRAARKDDLDQLYAMAEITGGGLTNLPADRQALSARLQGASASFARHATFPGDDMFLFVLEDISTGQIRGTCLIYAQVGTNWPFYSYRIGALSQTSKELDRTFRSEMLTLSTDLDGSSEVGGLFLHPHERASGVGVLLTRSRYLFMAMHRSRFADQTIAELRGSVDEFGNSPFWDAIGARFFGMSFHEADTFNGIHGNQFIADLSPKHPLYVAMLPENAAAAIGVPHESGRAAMHLLEKEGFHFHDYVDIFDGGPTMTCATDNILTIRDTRQARVTGIRDEARMLNEAALPSLIASGHLGDFCTTSGYVMTVAGTDLADDLPGVLIDHLAAARLSLKPGDQIYHVARS